MAGLDDILKMLPIDQIAAKLGVDASTARAAVEQGGGAILSGLHKNAETPEGASAIEAALGKHAAVPDAVDVDAVDTTDGEKILGHVFGGQQQQVAQTLTDSPQTAGIDFGKLLPMLAPIVMGLLAKNKSGTASSGGGIGDLIGGLLGGGTQSAGSAGGFDLGGLLGGLLGGKR